jgi:hypothetical protein
MYKIAPYTIRKARQMGVVVKPSQTKNKKIDVFRDGKRIASVGDIRYDDYATLLQTNPAIAEERRRLYHLRHTKNTIGEVMARSLLW